LYCIPLNFCFVLFTLTFILLPEIPLFWPPQGRIREKNAMKRRLRLAAWALGEEKGVEEGDEETGQPE
jgi:hypothetical protein